LIGIVDVLAFQGVICVRKTNIEPFSCLMRRMQWNDVRRKLFLVSENFNVAFTLEFPDFWCAISV